MPPQLDDLRSRNVVTGTPAGDDLIPYYDVSELGNAAVKKALVSSIGVQLDAAGNLPVDGLAIADSSGVALPAGVIGWNAALNAFTEHDGTTVGGNLSIPQDPLCIRGSAAFTSGLGVTSVRTLDAFALSADQVQAGAAYPLSGKICVAFVGTKPATASIGFVPTLYAGTGEGVVCGFDVGGANVSVYEINVVGVIQTQDAGGGTYNLQESALSSLQTRLTTATTSFSNVAAVASGLEIGTLGEAQEWVLELHLEAQAALIQVLVSWDLLLEMP